MPVYNGQINLTCSVLDSHSRQCGFPPVIQGWTPTLDERRKLTVPSEEWLEVDIPTGATAMHFDLTGQFGIRFNWEEGVTAADGFPITPATVANGLPYFSGVGPSPTCWLYNSGDDDAEFQVFFY